MKSKYVFIILTALILAASMSFVAATQYASLKGVDFEIPDEFETYNQSSEMIVINNDDNDVISIYAPSNNFTAEQLKKELVKEDYEFMIEDTHEFKDTGVDVTLQNYVYNNMTVCIYLFTVDDQLIQITFIPHDSDNVPEYSENPVSDIVDSILD